MRVVRGRVRGGFYKKWKAEIETRTVRCGFLWRKTKTQYRWRLWSKWIEWTASPYHSYWFDSKEAVKRKANIRLDKIEKAREFV